MHENAPGGHSDFIFVPFRTKLKIGQYFSANQYKMKKRGRPRQFDEAAVTEAMTRLFWRKGFAATSLDDIAAATGLNRPSLYRAFGHKIDMYTLCLDHFAKRMAKVFEKSAASEKALDGILNHLFLKLIDIYYAEASEEAGLGCLVFSSAVAEAPSNDRIQQTISAGLETIRASFRACLARHGSGQSRQNVELAVEVALSIFLALGVQIRAGMDRHEAERKTDRSVAAICQLLDLSYSAGTT